MGKGFTIVLQTAFFLASPSHIHHKQNGTPSRWPSSGMSPLRPGARGEGRSVFLLLLEHTLSEFRAKHCFHKDVKKLLPSLPGPEMPFFWHWLTKA